MNAKRERDGAVPPSDSNATPAMTQKKNIPQRARKRSLFGKASKIALPTEPLPQAPQHKELVDVLSRPGESLEEDDIAASPPAWQTRHASTSTASSYSQSRRTPHPESGSSPWYQRGIFSKAQQDSHNRPSASSSSIADSRKPSLSEFGSIMQQSQDYDASLRSPSRIRRTFSRRSVYSINQEDEADGASQDDARRLRSGSVSDFHSKSEKRRWFAKQADSSTTQSLRDVPLEAGSSSPHTRKEGLIQRTRSRSIFRGNHASAASTDTLASAGSSGTPHDLPASRAEKVGEAELSRGEFTGPSRGTLTVPGQGHEETTAIPKRLSGWLLNMLGTEPNQSDTVSPIITALDESSGATLRNKVSTASMSRVAGQSTDQIVSDTDNSTQRVAKSGMLSSLASVGRHRADQPISGPNSSHNNNTGNFARSGLDRALRYFIDTHEQDVDADEGIWLLGVWHGPIADDEITHNAQKSGAGTEAIMHDKKHFAPDSSIVRNEVAQDDGSSTTSLSAHRVKRTPSSITSATSAGSVVLQTNSDHKDAVSRQENESFIIAHNPPTPHTSPVQGSSTRANRVARSTNYAAAGRLLSSIAVGAERTESFQADFSTRIWCTYRSHFTPICRDGSISQQAEDAAALHASLIHQEDLNKAVTDLTSRANNLTVTSSTAAHKVSHYSPTPETNPTASYGGLSAAFGLNPSGSTSGSVGGLGEKMGIPNLWNRAAAAAQAYGLAGRAGLTTDAGWGCMLRTGQSVLANALLSAHLGRSWRRITKPLPPRLAPKAREAPDSYASWCEEQHEYARYTRILSWFMDEPSKACPFGVHRMAREGKRLGKEVGEWFGPSTAAGAIKKLVDEFPACGLSVNIASDGVVYLNHVRAAAMQRGKSSMDGERWSRPVLILIGVRLGLEGVHPMYHDTIKATFSLPHSVGIAGGRPSSSYYFVGYQGNSLFYLDPHQVRPSVTFKHPPVAHEDSDEWWAQAYSEHDLATFHNDKPRRMPMKNLDPSMLLGFLIQDAEALNDFVARVKDLPRPIFSVQESMPKWMTNEDMGGDDVDLENERAIESISEGSFDVGERDEARTSHDDIVGASGQTSRMDLSEVNTVVGDHAHALRGNMSEVGEEGVLIPRRDNNRSETADLTFGVHTPLSEGTFELIGRQSAPPSSDVPSHLAPISFPSKGGDADEEEVLVEHGAGGLYSGSQDIYAPSHLAQGTLGADHEADSAWEEVQSDVLSSPRSMANARQYHDR